MNKQAVNPSQPSAASSGGHNVLQEAARWAARKLTPGRAVAPTTSAAVAKAAPGLSPQMQSADKALSSLPRPSAAIYSALPSRTGRRRPAPDNAAMLQAISRLIAPPTTLPTAMPPKRPGTKPKLRTLPGKALEKRQAAKDQIPGGKADKKPASKYPERELAMGRKVEMEHTDSPGMATEIAKDHLEEFSDYYTRLKRMEHDADAAQKAAALAPLDMGDLRIHDREQLGLDIEHKGHGKLSFFTQGGELGLMEWLADKYPAGRKSNNVLLGHRKEANLLDAIDYARMELAVNTLAKEAGDMPPFTEQDRPAKVKEIYRALKRDHPEMPAEMKARIAARQGKPGKQKQGPPYKGKLAKPKKKEKEAMATQEEKRALFTGVGIGALIGAMRARKRERLRGAGYGAGIGAGTELGAGLGGAAGGLAGLLGGPLAPLTVPLGALGGAGLGGYGGYKATKGIMEDIGEGSSRGMPWGPTPEKEEKSEKKEEKEPAAEEKDASFINLLDAIDATIKQGYWKDGVHYSHKTGKPTGKKKKKPATKQAKADRPCPGSKIRSKGKGRGKGRGKGKGPIGVPIGEKKAVALLTAAMGLVKASAGAPVGGAAATMPAMPPQAMQQAVTLGQSGPAVNVSPELAGREGWWYNRLSAAEKQQLQAMRGQEMASRNWSGRGGGTNMATGARQAQRPQTAAQAFPQYPQIAKAMGGLSGKQLKERIR